MFAKKKYKMRPSTSTSMINTAREKQLEKLGLTSDQRVPSIMQSLKARPSFRAILRAERKERERKILKVPRPIS